MDQQAFDRLARMLGEARDRRAGLKVLVGGLFGVGGATAALDPENVAAAKRKAGTTARDKDKDKGKDRDKDANRRKDRDADTTGPDADRRKRKKACKPACIDGHVCQKVGKKRQCVCPSGLVCGGACCAAGKACRDGVCADGPGPDPAECIGAGQPCKSVGRACCDGRVCASGQGGEADIACYVPKTGRCERAADCVYGMRCRDGRCTPPQPGDLAEPCDAAAQQLCTTPGATCTGYTRAGAPAGAHCSLPLRSACSGDQDCSCYKCWYLQDGITASGARGRSSGNMMGCCHPENTDCASDEDCCLGLSCNGGICGQPGGGGGGGGGGSVCVPDDAAGCPGARCCSPLAICIAGFCKLAVPTGDTCSIGQPDSLPCADAPEATCRVGDAENVQRCRVDAGAACDGPEDCVTDACGEGRCKARTTEACGTSNNGAACRETHDQCMDVGTAQEPDFECRSVAGTPCTAGDDCISGACSGSPKVCEALTEEACGTSNNGAACRDTTDTCHDAGAGGKVCLREAGVTCTADTQCISAECGGTAPNQVCKALTGETCGASNAQAICKFEDTTDDCRASYTDPTGATKCLRPVGAACTDGTDCYSGGCGNDRCKAVTTEACGGSPAVQCQVSGDVCSGAAPNQTCLRPAGEACTSNDQCASGTCGANSQCAALTTEACGASSSPTGAECAATATDTCVASGGTSTCLRANGVACEAGNQCVSGTCGTNGQCAALTTEACDASSTPTGAPCAAATDTCSGTSPDQTCLRANGVACEAGNQCVSGTCGTNGQCAALTTEACGASSSPTGAECAATTTDTCADSGGGAYQCLRANGVACAASNQCASGTCGTNGKCAALTTEACGASSSPTGAECAATATDTCVTSGGTSTCLRANGVACAASNQCASGTCGMNGQCAALTTEACDASSTPTGAPCAAATDTCSGTAPDQTCLRDAGITCTVGTQCISGNCSGTPAVCEALTEQKCGTSNNGAVCKATTDTCSGADPDKTCLRDAGVACTAGTQCVSGACDGGVCKALTEQKCGTSNNGAVCRESTDTCSGADPDKTCLRNAGVTCTTGTQCISGACSGQDGAKVCEALAGETCETANAGAACKSGEGTCRLAFGETGADTRCRLDAAEACTAADQCYSNGCTATGATTGFCKSLDGESCALDADCVNAPDATCTTYADGTPTDTRCLRAAGGTCAAGPGAITADQTCVSELCAAAVSPAIGTVCAALVGDLCGDDNAGAICKTGEGTCRAAFATPTGDVRCLRDAGAACSAGTDCYSGGCANGVCQALTGETCGGTPEITCQVSGDVCHDSGTGKTCLRPAGVSCTDGAQCISGGCSGSVGSKVCDALTKETCGTSNNGAACAATTDTCSGTSPNQTCLRDAGVTCTEGTQCISAECATAVSPATGSVCKALAGQTCEAANNGATCKEAAADCRLAFGATTGDTRCRRDGGESCTADDQCYSGSCASGVCKALDGEACGTSNNSAACLNAPAATCTTYAVGTPTGNYCLRAVGGTCAAGPGAITANDTCASKVCDDGTCVACTLDTHCSTATPVCDTTTNTCVTCTSTNIGACTGSTPVCGAANTCVQCTADATGYCGTGDATGKPICDTTKSTCVQCSAEDSSACTGTTPVCNATTGTCVQCDATDKTACTGTTPVCDTANFTCVQCLAASDCDSLSAGGCTLYACSGSKTCVANGTKPVNSICSTGYCQADGTCGATVACSFTRASCNNDNATCGTTLKTTIANAAQGAVIGIPAGTYAITSPIVLDQVEVGGVIQNRKLTMVKCEATKPVLDGGWNSSTSTPTGNQILKIRNAELTIDGVNFTKGYAPTGNFGGAIGIAGTPAATLDGSIPFIVLRNLSITNSYAAAAGGGIYTYAQATLDSVQITGNKSYSFGGGYYVATLQGNGATLNNVTITGNTANLQGITTGAINGAGLYVNDAKDGDNLTCTGTNSISNSPASYVYDCGYDSAVVNKFAPNNFAGCGCATVECGNAQNPNSSGTWNVSTQTCTCSGGRTWNGQQCVCPTGVWTGTTCA